MTGGGRVARGGEVAQSGKSTEATTIDTVMMLEVAAVNTQVNIGRRGPGSSTKREHRPSYTQCSGFTLWEGGIGRAYNADDVHGAHQFARFSVAILRVKSGGRLRKCGFQYFAAANHLDLCAEGL